MKPALHQLSLPGAMLTRGFWLYVSGFAPGERDVYGS